MRRFLIGVLACIGGLALLVAVVVAILVSRYISHETELPGRILLTADWRERLSESAAVPSILDLELHPRPTITDIVLALDAAAADPRVRGLLVRLAETSNGFGATQELRDAFRTLYGVFSGQGAAAVAEVENAVGMNLQDWIARHAQQTRSAVDQHDAMHAQDAAVRDAVSGSYGGGRGL